MGAITLAAAQPGREISGTMSASAQGAIAKGAAISIRALSGGPDTRAIADLFREALEDAGYKNIPPRNTNSSYRLTFQISGDRPDRGRGSGFELRGSDGSSGSGDVELKMRWKATRDKPPERRRGRRLTIAISDQDRTPIWRADIDMQAGDGASGDDDLAMMAAVMPALIANIGRTVFALRVP